MQNRKDLEERVPLVGKFWKNCTALNTCRQMIDHAEGKTFSCEATRKLIDHIEKLLRETLMTMCFRD
jgi:hypothetical protein